MIAVPWRAIGVLALVLIGAASAWQIQDWRYGKQLAVQARLHSDILNQQTQAGAAAQKIEQDKRLVLEQRISASEQTHFEKLTNAQRDQDRMRDRLATADVRLSVLLAANESASGYAMSATPGACGVVHAGVRAELDPAHAQRIIAITDEGDRAVIALRACQAYARTIEARDPASP